MIETYQILKKSQVSGKKRDKQGPTTQLRSTSYTHRTRNESSALDNCSRLFVTGAESHLLCATRGNPSFSWLTAINVEFFKLFSIAVFSISVVDSVDDADEADDDIDEEPAIERIVELTNGRPISWKEFIELKPLSSSIDDKMPSLMRSRWLPCWCCWCDGMFKRGEGRSWDEWCSSSVSVFNEDEELVVVVVAFECTESSVLLRIERRDSRDWDLRVKGSSFFMRGSRVGGMALFVGFRSKGSWVFIKFWTVRSKRYASFDSFSGFVSRFEGACLGFGERRLERNYK